MVESNLLFVPKWIQILFILRNKSDYISMTELNKDLVKIDALATYSHTVKICGVFIDLGIISAKTEGRRSMIKINPSYVKLFDDFNNFIVEVKDDKRKRNINIDGYTKKGRSSRVKRNKSNVRR